MSKDGTLQPRYRPVTALSCCLISLKEIYSKGKRDKNQQTLNVNDAFEMNEHAAARLAQLGERRSAEREAIGSNPGRTNTQGL